MIDLKNIENQTEKICLEAVKQYGCSLEYVKEQTEEICLEAVKEDGCALEYVKNQTPEICIEALKENQYALEFVQNQTYEMCLEAVKEDGLVLEFIKEQTPEICLEAVKENGRALEYVKDLYMIRGLEPKIIKTNHRTIYILKLNNEYKFSVGCLCNTSKETFINRICNTDGGLEANPHRQEYLDILKEY